MPTISFLLLFFTITKAYSGLKEEKMYHHERLDKICPENGGKYHVSVKTVTVITFTSLHMDWELFKCHLELEVISAKYGFSVFIEEMTLEASDKANCLEDYVQFGRDILFVTSHKSRKYCGIIEAPVPRKGEGVSGFSFPKTPLVKRIYAEENDSEMDLWVQVTTPPSGARPKTFTLVITPFKKYCGQNDLYYRQCRFSTKCVRKELFCDGRINCAWPYSEPADEVYCKQTGVGSKTVWSISNFPVILVVLMVIMAVLMVLCCGLTKFIERVKQSKREEEEDSQAHGAKTHLEDLLEINNKLKVQKHQKDIKELSTILGVHKLHHEEFKELNTILEEDPKDHEDLKELSTIIAVQKQKENFKQLSNILDVHIAPNCPPLPSPSPTYPPHSIYPPLQSPNSNYPPLQSSNTNYSPLESPNSNYPPLQSSNYSPLQSPNSIYPSLPSPSSTHSPVQALISSNPPPDLPTSPYADSLNPTQPPENPSYADACTPMRAPSYSDSPIPEQAPSSTDPCTPSVPNTTSSQYFTQLHKPY